MSRYSEDSGTYAQENIERAAAVSEDVIRKFKRFSENRLGYTVPSDRDSKEPGNLGNEKLVSAEESQPGRKKTSFKEYRSGKLAKVRDVERSQAYEQKNPGHGVYEQKASGESFRKPTVNEQKKKPADSRQPAAKVPHRTSAYTETTEKKVPKKKNSSGPGIGLILIAAFLFGMILFCTIDTISTVSIAVLGGVASEGGAGADKYVEWMIAQAEDDTHGYRNVVGFNSGNPDYDCGGFVSIALQAAGIFKKGEFGEPNDESRQKTSTLGNYLLANGFEQMVYVNKDTLIKGDILMSYGHVETYIGNGQLVGAHNDFGHPEKGDQGGNEVSVTGYFENNWVHVYRYFAGEEESTEQNIITEPETKKTK